MKRWLTHATIVLYLAALSWGIFAHTLRAGNGVHPAMYFVVWDMFCGWSSWASKVHIIGEGESGTYYELGPAPWGDLHPFGSLDRQDYDPNAIFSARLAVNCLKHTQHEPILRIFVVEEYWPKKVKLMAGVQTAEGQPPPDFQKYYRVRHVFTGEGQFQQTFTDWLSYQSGICISNNPRLRAETRKSAPFYAFGDFQPADNPYSPGGHFGFAPGAPSAAGVPLGRMNGN